MKKLLFLLAAVFISSTASAQIVMSRSVYKQKKPYQANFYIKAGAGLDGGIGLNDKLDKNYYGSQLQAEIKSVNQFAYNISFGFDRTIGQHGAYWAVEVGGGSRGIAFDVESAQMYNYGTGYVPLTDAKFTDDPNCTAFFIHLMPQIGWKFKISDNIKFDTHIGGFAGISLPINYIHAIEYINSTGARETTTLSYYGSYYWGEYDDTFDVGAQIGIGLWIDRFNIDLSYRQGFLDMLKGPDGIAYKVFLSLGYAIPLHK